MDAFTPLIAVHAVAALYVLVLGPFQILRRRRDLAHRIIGLSWVSAIVVTCVTSFFMIPTEGVSWLHALSAWTLVCMAIALIAVRRGVIPVHRGFMVGSYIGTVIAFAFAALVPARRIPQLLQHEPVIALGTLLGVAIAVAIFAGSTLRITRRRTAMQDAAQDAVQESADQKQEHERL